MEKQVRKCIGVVDGGMIILDDGESYLLDGVRAPRMGVPGGAAMRTVLQRHVQDKEVSYEILGRDRSGYTRISAFADGNEIAALMSEALKEYGYGS
jgi:hypothetical protein